MERIKELLNKNKKVLVRSILAVVIGGCVLGVATGIFIYTKAKNNINYTIDEAQNIALQTIEGEVISVKKNLEVDTLSYEYEFKIKDSRNMLVEVTVDSKLGVITDIDD